MARFNHLRKTALMSWILVYAFCFFDAASTSLLGHEPTKPSREHIVAFLDEYRNAPLSEEEKKVGWNERKKVDLVEKFGSDFSNLDLSSIDFDLKTRKVLANGADFSGSDMQAVRFDGAELRGCRFIETDLRNAMLRYCKCENADFSDSKIPGTRFLFSEMQNVVFRNLDAKQGSFLSIDFSGSDLSGTNFSGAEFWYGGEFNRANLAGTDLSGVHLENAEFVETRLNNAKFLKTHLSKADFSRADLEGADFTGAKLYAAVFDDVKGIDATRKRSLESRSMKWFYDFTVVGWEFLEMIFFPGFIATVLSVLVFSIYGLTRKEKSKLFVTALVSNAFALFSTACTLLMLFSGGHPVRQMSLGNMDAWSDWLHFWPILAIGMLAAITVSLVVFVVYLSRLAMRKTIIHPWLAMFYLLLTILHTFWALNWLGMFMPDA